MNNLQVKIDLPFTVKVSVTKLNKIDGYLVSFYHDDCGRYEYEIVSFLSFNSYTKFYFQKIDDDSDEDVGTITIYEFKHFQYPYTSFYQRDKETENFYFINRNHLNGEEIPVVIERGEL